MLWKTYMLGNGLVEQCLLYNRRRPVQCALVLALSAILGVSLYYQWSNLVPRHRITRESFELLHKGLTVAEVQAILQSPPGRYTRHRLMHAEFITPVRYVDEADLTEDSKTWISDEIEIGVTFDRTGRLGEKWICRMSQRSDSF